MQCPLHLVVPVRMTMVGHKPRVMTDCAMDAERIVL
jgi:hypothetical protein